MATIDHARIRLHSDQPNTTVFPVATDAAWEAYDLLKVTSGEIDKLASGGAGATDLCLAVDKQPDAYWEPLDEERSEHGVILLGNGVLVEMSVDGDIAQANFGSAFGISVTGGIAVVNLADTTNTAFVPLRLADELYGGVVGDTDVRVVGYFLDSVCAGEA